MRALTQIAYLTPYSQPIFNQFYFYLHFDLVVERCYFLVGVGIKWLDKSCQAYILEMISTWERTSSLPRLLKKLKFTKLLLVKCLGKMGAVHSKKVN